MRTFHYDTPSLLPQRCIFQVFSLLFRNSELANPLDRTSNSRNSREGEGGNFSNKFRHAISRLPKPWEQSLIVKEWLYFLLAC